MEFNITNYQMIRRMSVYKMARFLEDKLSLPFEIAILGKRERINYIKRWLLSERR